MDASLQILGWLLSDVTRSFTIREAAAGADVNASAMRSFFERNRGSFQPLGREATGQRGGSSMRYRLTQDGSRALRARIPEPLLAPSPRMAVGIPSNLLAALAQLVGQPAEAAATRERVLRLARRILAEQTIVRTEPAVAALYEACQVLFELGEHEQLIETHLVEVVPLAYLRRRVVGVQDELDRTGLPEWSSRVSKRFLTSPVQDHQEARRAAIETEPAPPVQEHQEARRAAIDRVLGTVTGIDTHGVDLHLDIGDGHAGFVHIADIVPERIANPREYLHERVMIGDEVVAMVLGVSNDPPQIRLGIKQLADSVEQPLETTLAAASPSKNH